jgi:hypothetical protein
MLWRCGLNSPGSLQSRVADSCGHSNEPPVRYSRSIHLRAEKQTAFQEGLNFMVFVMSCKLPMRLVLRLFLRSINRHAKATCAKLDVFLQVLLSSTIDESQWPSSLLADNIHGERAPGNLGTEGWMGPTAALVLCQNQTPIFRSFSL